MISEKQKEILFKVLPKTLIFGMKRIQLKNREKSDLANWEANGRSGAAPHRHKQEVLRDYAKQFQIKTLVETGTFLGLMMEAQSPYFDELISIELDTDLFLAAKKRFQSNSKVKIIQGDSGEMIAKVVPSLKNIALFWLDGHYSGGFTAKGALECPIFGELTSILADSKEHVILIDDARCFVGKNDYPTIEELSSFIKRSHPERSITVQDDIIRVLPKQV